MSIPSSVTFRSNTTQNGKKTVILDIWNYSTLSELYVTELCDGIFTIFPSESSNIYEFVQFVEGIFHPNSNFTRYICSAYNVPMEQFKGVKFLFNGPQITVTANNADAKSLLKEWQTQIKKLRRES